MNDEVSFKGKSEETTAKSDTNLRGKASGWLRHKGNLNWAFTKKSWRRLRKCFSIRTKNLISFIPFLLCHNFTIWSHWNAMITGCFCFQASSLQLTKKSETQNFHSLTMVCFQRLIEQETEDEFEIQSSIVRKKRGTRCVALAYRKEGAIEKYARLELRRYLQIFGQSTFGGPPSLLVQHIFQHYDFRQKPLQLFAAS